MLDEMDFIHKYNTDGALEAVASQVDQLNLKFNLGDLNEFKGVEQIVVAGMGGSAQPAEFIKTWLGDSLTVPLVIVRDYELPGFVGPETLFAASSYSGNTEEVLAALTAAERCGARIVVSCAGGKLLEIAKSKNYPLLQLPGGCQPRLSVPAAIKAFVELFEAIGLLNGAAEELENAGKWLSSETGAWQADVPAINNDAKKIASELVGHPIVVYAGSVLSFMAQRVKIALNENSKNIAFYNYLPEMNHNEFIGWNFPHDHSIKVIEIRSDLDNDRVNKRFEVMNRLLSNRFAPIEIQAKGDTRLRQMLWVLMLGDYVSMYLGFLNGINPIPVELVEKLKRELG